MCIFSILFDLEPAVCGEFFDVGNSIGNIGFCRFQNKNAGNPMKINMSKSA